MRKPWTTKQKLQIAIRYAKCPICGLGFSGLDEIDWDHEGQLSLTEDNSIENGRPVHRLGCHARKNQADSAARAKTRRLTKKEEEFRQVLLSKGMFTPEELSDRKTRKRKWPTRSFRQSIKQRTR